MEQLSILGVRPECDYTCYDGGYDCRRQQQGSRKVPAESKREYCSDELAGCGAEDRPRSPCFLHENPFSTASKRRSHAPLTVLMPAEGGAYEVTGVARFTDPDTT